MLLRNLLFLRELLFVAEQNESAALCLQQPFFLHLAKLIG